MHCVFFFRFFLCRMSIYGWFKFTDDKIYGFILILYYFMMILFSFTEPFLFHSYNRIITCCLWVTSSYNIAFFSKCYNLSELISSIKLNCITLLIFVVWFGNINQYNHFVYLNILTVYNYLFINLISLTFLFLMLCPFSLIIWT